MSAERSDRPGAHRPPLKVRHVVEYLIMRLMEGVTRPLPRGATLGLARTVAWLFGSVLKIRRKTIAENLQTAFGPANTPEEKSERESLISENYRRTVLTFLEFLQASVRRRDIVADLGHAEELLPIVQAGPVLMVTGHIGNWEAFGVLLADYDLQGAMLAKPIHNRLIQQRVLDQRRSIPGVEIILTSNSMKAVVQCVREGKHVGFVADQDARRNGVFVPFFGRPASTARGPALFCLKLGLPLIPLFMVRDPARQLRLCLVAGTPIYPDQTADEEQEILRITALHTAQLEATVRQHPADYFWMHNRWKTRPKVTTQKLQQSPTHQEPQTVP